MAFSKTLDPEFDWFESCLLCSSPKLRVWEVSEKGYSVHPLRVRCAGCGLIFSNPQASRARLQHFYSKVYFQDQAHKGAYFGKVMEREQLTKAAEELALLEAGGPKGKVLDVGCAAGYFLMEAKRRGWQAEGSELSAEAASHAKKRGFKVHVGEVEALKLRGRFDVVHAAHTLEHVKDPLVFLNKLRSFLKPGGRLLIEVPNAYQAWALAWHYGARLKGRTAPLTYAKEHTFDFSKTTLKAVMEKSGLKVTSLRAYEYPTGLLRLKHKADDNFSKKMLRPLLVSVAQQLGLENILGSYLQVIALAKESL